MSPHHGESASAKTPWFIWVCLLAALAIFTAAAAVIYYRFMTTPETNCSIVVHGNPDLEGCTVLVERITALAERQRLSDTFTKANGNSARFFVPSATYRIELWSPEKTLLQSYPNEFIPPGTRLSINLGDAKLARPATRSGGRPSFEPAEKGSGFAGSRQTDEGVDPTGAARDGQTTRPADSGLSR